MQNKSQMCKVYTVILLAPQEVSLHVPNVGQAQEVVNSNITRHRQHCPLQPVSSLSTKPETKAFLTVLSEKNICTLNILWKEI